jgi:hypothetical protein
MSRLRTIVCTAFLVAVAGSTSAPATACPWNGCGTDAYNSAQARASYDTLYAFGPQAYGYAPLAYGYGPAAYGYMPPNYGATAYGCRGRRACRSRPAYGYYGPAPAYGYYLSRRLGWDYGLPLR